ncbi:hypothetical protein [Bordetella genomosp. 4]|uniref:Uncharacterized protein n=1 Tax=Bordetella genomosp. 4 TaxID=463044 RepID=A0A261U722_9BORD|nr:hypothetical protein [Bordetella genomosp. 4]OZI51234.1 hypothetical protein CAL21_04765 [Bordetella genomosp. 4]OZI57425.1 hypothetical protein CAL20_08485 [Bordetella genomosp. 4]
MPIVLAFIVLAAIIYGAVALYMSVAAKFGWLAGVGADVLAVALVVAVIAGFVHRYRTIHGKTVNGKRVLSLTESWGGIRIDANEKRGSLVVDGNTAQFIFTDICNVRALTREGRWMLALHLAHNAQGDWELPMPDRKQAHRWAKILTLAGEQNL